MTDDGVAPNRKDNVVNILIGPFHQCIASLESILGVWKLILVDVVLEEEWVAVFVDVFVYEVIYNCNQQSERHQFVDAAFPNIFKKRESLIEVEFF